MNIAWRVHIFGKLFDVLIFSRKSVFKPFNFLENYYENMRPKKTTIISSTSTISITYILCKILKRKKIMFPIIQSLDLIT